MSVPGRLRRFARFAAARQLTGARPSCRAERVRSPLRVLELRSTHFEGEHAFREALERLFTGSLFASGGEHDRSPLGN